jgi:hypothetical protein
MNQDLQSFAAQWVRIAVMALVPVVFTAFISIPMSLGGHPGEGQVRVVSGDGHMT